MSKALVKFRKPYNIFNKVPKVNPDLKSLKSLKSIPKTDFELHSHVKSLKKKSLVNKLLKSKLVLGGGAAVALSAIYVDGYIKGNTGCFLQSKDNTTCKLLALSCCNPYESKYVKKCDNHIIERLKINIDSCKNYNLSSVNCCEKCNCDNHNCDEGETMSCHRATTAEAVSYFADNMTSTIGDTIYNTLSSSIKYLLIGFIVIVIVLIIYKFI